MNSHELGLLRRAGLGVNVLQVGFGRGLTDPQVSAASLTLSPGAMARSTPSSLRVRP